MKSISFHGKKWKKNIIVEGRNSDSAGDPRLPPEKYKFRVAKSPITPA